jgi:signal peptidase II
VTLFGTIIDLTGTTLSFRPRQSATIERYAASQVDSYDMAKTESHELGLRAFAAGRIDQAEKQFASALDDEDRAWVRREILAMLVRCALWRGDRQTAAARCLPILESDPDWRRYELLPLAWETAVESGAASAAATNWLTSRLPAVRLIGASHLLATRTGGAAADELQRLGRLSATPIGPLATIQLWRLRLRDQNLKHDELSEWQQQVEALPGEVRAGPSMLLGAAWRTVGDERRAAACYLWTALADDPDRNLAASGLAEAAQLMSRSARADEVRVLGAEMARRFGDTPSAAPTATLLKSLSPSEPSR